MTYYLTMAYPNHQEIIFESDDLDAVVDEYQDSINDHEYNRLNDVEYYEVWSDDGSLWTSRD